MQTLEQVIIQTESITFWKGIENNPHTVVPTLSTSDTNLRHLLNKQKLTSLNQTDSCRSVCKRQDTCDQIDLLLLDAFSKENNASPEKESPKSRSELFFASLVEVFDCLSRKWNQMACTEIIPVLMKQEIADD